MLQSLFAVGIVFLCILTNIRGVLSRVYFTNDSYEWVKAKNQCTLLENEKNVAHSHFPTKWGWTNYAAKYLPWVEYLGCFQFRNMIELHGSRKQVTEGEQLQECMVHCSGFAFFGLQESTCLCLHDYSRQNIVKSCDTNVATCFGDTFAFCGMGGREFVSVYQNDDSVNIQNGYRYKRDMTGNCLEFDNTHGILQPNNCSTELNSMCFDDVYKGFNAGNTTNWRYAFNDCYPHILANLRAVTSRSPTISARFWLSHTRRWTRILNVTGHPYFCVAARIKQNGVVEKNISRCRKRLPALCVEVRTASTDAPSKKSSTRSIGSTLSNIMTNTSSSLQRKTLQGLTISTYSASLRTTSSSQYGATTPALNKTTRRSEVNKSKEVQETTSSTPDWKLTTFPVVDDSSSTDLPGSEDVSAILFSVIVAATILIVIIILVLTIVLCRRKRNTQVPISNEPLALVEKEVMYAQVNKPTVKREESTSSQNPQPAASDDTYDHMDHRRLSQTHKPIESNYDTMRSIANAGEEENNYDHVTGTKNEPTRFVVDGVSNYSHVEVDFQEVKDI